MGNSLSWRSRRAGLAMLAGLAATALQAGCADNKGPLSNASPIEREFALAAVTWDLNRDGDVTCDEWKQYAAGLFREADKNRDGFLSPEEFAAMSRQDRLFEFVGFKYFDANGDGRLTLAEIADKPNPAFILLDKNKDCVLTPDERAQRRIDYSPSKPSDGQLPSTKGR